MTARRLRILLVTPYYSTHGGGIEIVAGKLAEIFARDHDIVWAASDCDATPVAASDSLRFVPMRSRNALERLTGLPFPLWRASSIARLWREVRIADFVHLHDFTYAGNWATFAFATIQARPTIITQHVGFIPYQSRCLRAALSILHSTVGRIMLGRASQVVFISRTVQNYYGRFVRLRRPSLLIENGVDVRTFQPTCSDRATLRQAIGLRPDRPVLLFVGRFVEKKGLHILEGLARAMTDVSWVFAGWGPLDPRQWNCAHVHVFQDLRESALVPLYRAADLLVLPSVGEGLPLVVQEALSCGTPVMVGEDTAAAIGAPPDVVISCRVGQPGATKAWEDALRRVLNDSGALSDRRTGAAAFAQARWSWNVCSAAYLSLFAKCVPQSKGMRSH